MSKENLLGDVERFGERTPLYLNRGVKIAASGTKLICLNVPRLFEVNYVLVDKLSTCILA